MSSRALCSYAPADEMDNTYLEAVGIQEDDINHIEIARLSQTVIVHQRWVPCLQLHIKKCKHFGVFQHFVLRKLSKKSSITINSEI